MNKISLKNWHVATIILFLIFFGTLSAYFTDSRDPFTVLFKRIYPAVIVGSSAISVYDWQENLKIAKKINPQGDISVAGDTMIYAKAKRLLVGQLNIPLTQERYEEELAFITFNKTAEINNLASDYFNGEQKLFSKYVVMPRLTDALLREHHNTNTNINRQAFARANDVLARIQNGEKFEDLAREISDDKFSGQLGGSLGYVRNGEILPELKNVLASATVGEIKQDIVVSREGYHILFPEESIQADGRTLMHLKHIFIETDGFEDWLNSMLQTVSVRRIL